MSEPRTEAGKALLGGNYTPPGIKARILAIEEQAAAEARRELLAKVEGLPRESSTSDHDNERMAYHYGWDDAMAAVIALLDPSRLVGLEKPPDPVAIHLRECEAVCSTDCLKTVGCEHHGALDPSR